ncbi:hypothetical protein ACQ4M4_25825 [Leptolyngbya sp. AN02str]|uniref:hypothetical protein n=1 Tax=Leptolyngbya sp. AN02str TaxID=3423363 RepID=UPI003D310076
MSESLKLYRRKAKARAAKGSAASSDSTTPTAAAQSRGDSYLDRQEKLHGSVAKGASAVHLALGTALSWLKTFFQRSMLSIIAMLVLLIGMALAAEVYCVAAGVLPAPIIPKPGVGFSASKEVAQVLLTSSTAWDWAFMVGVSIFAVFVQILQWGSVRYIVAHARIAKNGGLSPLNGFELVVFGLFMIPLWYMDLSIVSSAYLVEGFSISGLFIFLWAAVPAEIANAIANLQRSLPEEE